MSTLQFPPLLRHLIARGWDIVDDAREEREKMVLRDPEFGLELMARTGKGFDLGHLAETFVRGDYNRMLFSGKTVLDLGASTGETALYFAAKGASRVIALEPTTSSWKLLKVNLDLNPQLALRIFPIKAAIAPTSGVLKLRTNSNLPNGNSLTGMPGLVPYDGEEEVDALCLPDILSRAGCDKVDFTKIDIEGAEYALFSSLKPEDVAKLGQISMEYHQGPGNLLERLVESGHTCIADLRGFPQGMIHSQPKTRVNILHTYTRMGKDADRQTATWMFFREYAAEIQARGWQVHHIECGPSRDDRSYETALRALWWDYATLLILEMDLVPTLAMLDEILSCEHPLCAMDYLIRRVESGRISDLNGKPVTKDGKKDVVVCLSHMGDTHLVERTSYRVMSLEEGRGFTFGKGDETWADLASLGFSKFQAPLRWDVRDEWPDGPWWNLDDRVNRYLVSKLSPRWHIHRSPDLAHNHVAKDDHPIIRDEDGTVIPVVHPEDLTDDARTELMERPATKLLLQNQRPAGAVAPQA